MRAVNSQILFLLLLIASILIPVVFVHADEVYKCSEPHGTTLWSNNKNKPSKDSFSGVQPVVLIGQKKMTISWGDTKKLEAAEDRIWNAVVIQDTNDSVSAVALDEGEYGSTVMLFTYDRVTGYLYMSRYKHLSIFRLSNASIFAAKCIKQS